MTIVAAVDFESGSQKALRYAAELAESWGDELFVVHVRTPVAGPARMTPLPNHDEETIEAFAERTAPVDLEALVERVVPSTVTVRTLVTHGVPDLAIVEQAEEQNADLVVVSTHGRQRMEYILRGSVAERVMRRAPCPVLTIPEGYDDDD